MPGVLIRRFDFPVFPNIETFSNAKNPESGFRNPKLSKLLLRILNILRRLTLLPVLNDLHNDLLQFVIITGFDEKTLDRPGVSIDHMRLLCAGGKE